MLIGFRYLPPVTADQVDRYNPVERGAILTYCGAWGSEEEITLVDPGTYAIYKASEERTKEDAPASFVPVKWLNIQPAPPPEPTVVEAKSLTALEKKL